MQNKSHRKKLPQHTSRFVPRSSAFVQHKQGFVKLLVAIIIGLIILSYFGFDLRALMESPQTQANLKYFWSILEKIWNNYIWKGILYIWDSIIIGVVWENLMKIIGKN